MTSKKQNNVYVSNAFAEGKVDRKLRMLEGVARILSDNYNVTVHFSPDGECKTTTEVMTLPYDKGVDEALILGLCGHETGHLKFTEFKIARVIARHKKIHNRPLLYVIFNCLEDVRIEAEMEKVYPGFKEMFKRLIPYIKEKKGPMLEREAKIKQMRLDGKSDEDIEKEIAKDCRQERRELVRALRDAGFEEDYIKHEEEQLKLAQTSEMAEVQKILDVLYLMLRDYDYDWYPVEVIDHVEVYLLDIAEEVHQAQSSEDVLEVAIKVYKILTDDEKKLRKGAQKKSPGGGKKKKKQFERRQKGSGRPQSQQPGSGLPEEEEDGDGDGEAVKMGVSKTLIVGSKVVHLNDSSKKGVVTHIDPNTQEITVEWEQKKRLKEQIGDI